MWSFHDRIYTFCKSVLFSNIECLIFEFFRFLNWRKALKVFYIWILHVKLLKIHNFSARDFVTYFLICVGGVNKSLALHQLVASLPISKEQIYILSRKSSNLILSTYYNLKLYFEYIYIGFNWAIVDTISLILSNSVFRPLVIVSSCTT